MMQFTRTCRGLFAVFIATTLVLSGCGESGTEPEVTDLPEVNDYLHSLPDWSAFADVQPDENAPAGDELATMDGARLCTETPYSITENPEAIVTFGSAPNVMYLGSLIQGDTYLGGVMSMEELPIRQRAPLVIAINLFSGTQVADTVVNPDGASVQAGLDGLISDAFQGGQATSTRIYYEETETYSLRQATLSLGLSVRGLGKSVSGQLDYSATREEHTITAFYQHVMFEAFIVPPQTPAEFFSDAFTMEHLQQQIDLGNVGPDNLPVYVGRIQYGRMMMYTMTSTHSADDMALAVRASYGAASGELEASYQQILNDASYTFATIGGSDSTSNDALAKLKEGGIRAYFESEDPITSAVPLSYTLYNLADGSIAQVSETTEYTMTECAADAMLCFLNESEWKAAMDSLAPSYRLIELPTTADTLVMADSVDSPPGHNGVLPPLLMFDSVNTGYPFSFFLRAPQAPQFTFYDMEGSPLDNAFPGDQARSLSVGDVNDWENDDFEFQVPEWRPGTALFGFGITVGDNSNESGEFTEAFATGGLSVKWGRDRCVPSSPGTPGFLGVISTRPLTRVFFNERSTGDDIFIRDPVFGVLEW